MTRFAGVVIAAVAAAWLAGCSSESSASCAEMRAESAMLMAPPASEVEQSWDAIQEFQGETVPHVHRLRADIAARCS